MTDSRGKGRCGEKAKMTRRLSDFQIILAAGGDY
jgi:hypothetical protein